MSAQGLIVALLVLACALQASWKLMPAAWRRVLSARLLGREPVPVPATGCGGGCEGCGGGVKNASSTSANAPGSVTRPLVFHPRRPR